MHVCLIGEPFRECSEPEQLTCPLPADFGHVSYPLFPNLQEKNVTYKKYPAGTS